MANYLKYARFQIRRLMTEYPEHGFTGALAFGALFFVGIPYAVYDYNHPNNNVKAYKDRYTIFRPDDPRSYRIRCSPDVPPDDPHILRI